MKVYDIILTLDLKPGQDIETIGDRVFEGFDDNPPCRDVFLYGRDCEVYLRARVDADSADEASSLAVRRAIAAGLGVKRSVQILRGKTEA